MDTEFPIIWKAVGWSGIVPLDEPGSRLLTIQFLGSLEVFEQGVSFRLFGKCYYCSWQELAKHIGFDAKKCCINLATALPGYNRANFFTEISTIIPTDPKFRPANANIHHPTLKFMQKWIAITLFPRHDFHRLLDVELQCLYAIVHKRKIAPVKEMINCMLSNFRQTKPIYCTSLVTRIAKNIGALQGENVTYLDSPPLEITITNLIHGHIIKFDEKDHEKIVYFFPGFVNEIPLPNPELSLYKSPSLTFALVELDEARRSSVSRRSSHRRAMGEASGSQIPQPTPVPVPAPGFFAPTLNPGLTPTFQYEGMFTPHPDQAGGSTWHEAHTVSSDSEGLPPPPRHRTVDPTVLQDINTRLGNVELRTGEIAHTLTGFVQVSNERHQQYLQHQAAEEERRRQEHEAQIAFWHAMGYYPPNP